MELEVVNDLIARHSRGQTFLSKGERFSTTDGEAQALLQRFPQFVRAVPTPAAATSRAIVYEPATKPDGSPLLSIYWLSGDGRILGPAIPEFLARSGEQFWIVTTFEGLARWINANFLRSKKDFETQRPVVEVDRELLGA
jgi:hypothetical protein